MTNDHTNDKIFASQVERLRRELRSLNFGATEDLSKAPLLESYLQHYEFNSPALTPLAEHCMGTLDYQGLELVGHWWRVADARATVLVVHGLFDHTGLYLKMVRFLLQEGFAVFAVDMPGHGISEGPRGEIEDFREYVEVLDLCVDKISRENTVHAAERHQYIMLGQSTGAGALAHFLISGENRDKISSGIMLAPLLRPSKWWYVNWGWKLSHHFLKEVPRRFAINSNNDAFLDFLKNNDPLQSKTVSLVWVGAMRRWVKRFRQFHSCSKPVCILQGDDDSTVDWPYNLPRFQQKFPNNRVVMLPGAKHHLVNESAEISEEIYSEIREFLKPLSISVNRP